MKYLRLAFESLELFVASQCHRSWVKSLLNVRNCTFLNVFQFSLLYVFGFFWSSIENRSSQIELRGDGDAGNLTCRCSARVQRVLGLECSSPQLCTFTLC